jgi:hypothetical protein
MSVMTIMSEAMLASACHALTTSVSSNTAQFLLGARTQCPG